MNKTTAGIPRGPSGSGKSKLLNILGGLDLPSGITKILALGIEEQRVNVIIDFENSRETWEAIGSRRSRPPSGCCQPDLSVRWEDKSFLRGHPVRALPRR